MSNLSRSTQEELLQLQYELKRRQYNTDFYAFFKDAWKEIDPYTELQENWHITYLTWIAQRFSMQVINKEVPDHATVLINVPPRSLKSWIFNQALPVWAWSKEPSLPIITASYSEVLSLGFSRKSQQIMRTDWFKRLYGDTFSIEQSEGGREAVGETQTNKGGMRFSTSTGGTIVGKGFLIGVIDDPIKPSEARETKALQKNINFYNESFDTRRNNPKKSLAFIIMQRVAENDLSGYLSENYGDDDSFLHINLPAIKNGKEKIPYLDEFLEAYPEYKGTIYKRDYLFGDRFDESFVRKQQKKGSIFFSTQYQQDPVPDDGIMFKKEWLDIVPKEAFNKLKSSQGTKFRKTFVTDTAFTDKTINDPSAILGYALIHNTIYVTDYFSDHIDGAELPVWIEKCVHQAGYTPKDLITIEPKASGKIVTSLVKKSTSLNVIEYKYPKGASVNINTDKESRASAILSQVESGRVKLVEGDWNQSFLSELATFPIGSHDESVDCLVMAVLRGHFFDSKYKKFTLRRAN